MTEALSEQRPEVERRKGDRWVTEGRRLGTKSCRSEPLKWRRRRDLMAEAV